MYITTIKYTGESTEVTTKKIKTETLKASYQYLEQYVYIDDKVEISIKWKNDN